MNKAKVVTYVSLVLLSIAALLVAHDILSGQQTHDNQVQSKVDIYHHFSVYTTRLDNVLVVVEIDVDDSLPYSCDGWIPNDENGHNCVVVGSVEISQILTDYNLNLTYPVVRGE